MDVIKKIVKKDFEFLFFLLLLATIVYATSWGGEFLSDDIAGIAQNPNLGNFWQQLRTLSVTNITFSFIYNLFGPTPFWYHLVNTVFHVITVLAVYIVIALLANKKNLWILRLTTLLFALHPIETEGVAWISGFPYVAYTFFSLAGIMAFVLADRREVLDENTRSALKISWLVALCYTLALLSTEKAIVFPVLLFLYILLFSKLNRNTFKLTLPTIGVGLVYGLTLLTRFSRRVADVAPSYTGGPTVYNPLVQIPITIYSYIKLLIFPVGLTLYHEFAAFPRWEYYLAVGVTVLLLLSILYLLWQSKVSSNKQHRLFSETNLFARLIVFGLIFFIISLAPTLLPISIGWIVAERYAHLGSIGFFLVISVVIYTVAKKLSFKKHLKSLALTLAIILSILTIKRNLEWRSQDSLWPATVRESPFSAYAWNNMGDYYGRHGDIENSIKSFERARQLRPRYADATHNLGNTYMQIGEATKAAELFKKALEYNPTLYQSYENLGKIAIETKNYRNAQYYFSQAIKLNPNPFADYLNLYIAYDHAGKAMKAQETLSIARRLAGSDPQKSQIIQELILKLKQEKVEK